MVGNFLAASGPPELLLHILQQSESPRDVLSFALTCRFMSEVWHANGAGHAVVWRLLLHEIPHAKEALVAVCYAYLPSCGRGTVLFMQLTGY